MVIIRRTNTKEKILSESLRLFSTLGYNAVGVEMIAAAVKVTPPSLYKHFKGKQEILEELIELSDKKYVEHLFRIDDFTEEEFKKFSLDKFIEVTLSHVNNVLHDDIIRSVRKLCTIEQFRNERLRLMHLHNTYMQNEENSYTLLMNLFKARKLEVDPDADVHHLAKLFILPIIATVDRCYCEPEYEKEGIEFIKAHVRYVWNKYFK